MSKHKWIARQNGRIVADGAIEAASEREAMRAVIASRAWKGSGWSLRVGGSSMSFDEEELEVLAQDMGEEHEKRDEHDAMKKVAQAALDVLKNRRPKPTSAEVEEEKANADEEDKKNKVSISIDKEETFGVTPSVDAFTKARQYMDQAARGMPADIGIEVRLDVECQCGATTTGHRIQVNPVDPLRQHHFECDRCHRQSVIMPRVIHEIMDELQLEVEVRPVVDPTQRIGVLGGPFPWDDPKAEPMKDVQHAVDKLTRKGVGIDMSKASADAGAVTLFDENGHVIRTFDMEQLQAPIQRPDTLLTQEFARLGLPSGAAWMALDRIGCPLENVKGVRRAGDDVYVDFLTARRGSRTVCHFTFKELEQAW